MKPEVLQKDYTFGWLGALALIMGMLISTSFIAYANVLSIFFFKVNYQYSDLFLIGSNAIGFLGAIFAFDYFIARRQTGRKLKFNLSLTNASTLILIFPMMLGMMFIAEFIAAQIPTTGPFFGKYYKYFSGLMDKMTSDSASLILLAVVMAPLFEEIIFRGIIQKGLLNKGLKPWKAILFSALLFGLVHGNPWQFVGAILLGSVIGLVYYKTKSLLLSILLHAFNNLTSSLLIFFGKTESFAKTFNISEYIILGIGIVLFALFFTLFMKKYSAV